MKKILLTIAARGGSKGVKNKNIRPLCGKPLIAHTIDQAKRWGKADRIVCSTDSEAIAAIAREYGAEVPFMRPAELATDTAGKLAALRHALVGMEKLAGCRFDILVDLDATAPIRRISDIEGALQLFLDKKPKTVFSVVPSRKTPYFNMVEEGENGYVTLAKRLPGSVKRRQDAPAIFDMNASIYIYDRDFMLDECNISPISDRSLVWVMPEVSGHDIDTVDDFDFVEYLCSNGKVQL